MRRLAVVVGLGGLALAAACASLSGLSGGEPAAPPLVDAGPEAAPVEAAAPPDPCSHVTYPPPPAKDDDSTGEVAGLVMAVREESINGELDGGAPIGLDLDGVCTCFPDPTTAHGGDPSCIAPEGGARACDGDGGADRQIDSLFAAYSVPNSSPTSGPTLLLKVTKYNGRANDSEVFVGFVASTGIFDPTGCGDVPDGGDPPDSGGPNNAFPPTWRGCDRFSLDPESVLPSTTEPKTYLPGYVTDHVLVVPPTSKPVLLVVGTTMLQASSAVILARLTAVGMDMQPLVPQPDVGRLFRMDGVAGGRVNIGDALRAIATGQAVTDGGPLCGFPNFYNTVKSTFVCPSADIATSPSNDFKNVPCDALSLAAAFTAQPASFGEVRKPPKSACADPDAPESAALFDCSK